MPCRCDGYEPEVYYPKKIEELHEMCCQVQSLAHKLGFILESNGIKIPVEINRKLEKHRDILLKHKEEELKKDIDKAKGEILYMENKIKQIKGLGGVPTDCTLEQLEGLKNKVNTLTSELMRGRQLLGGV